MASSRDVERSRVPFSAVKKVYHSFVFLTRDAIADGFFRSKTHIIMAVAAEREYLTIYEL